MSSTRKGEETREYSTDGLLILKAYFHIGPRQYQRNNSSVEQGLFLRTNEKKDPSTVYSRTMEVSLIHVHLFFHTKGNVRGDNREKKKKDQCMAFLGGFSSFPSYRMYFCSVPFSLSLSLSLHLPQDPWAVSMGCVGGIKLTFFLLNKTTTAYWIQSVFFLIILYRRAIERSTVFLFQVIPRSCSHWTALLYRHPPLSHHRHTLFSSILLHSDLLIHGTLVTHVSRILSLWSPGPCFFFLLFLSFSHLPTPYRHQQKIRE
ncbi:hypothetical protein BDF14DRAFT_1185975 [Spinellus fusiger]|nr:hypothetical protein BDF14DRAFT_1185975 [Spinellus fusiger]